MGLESITSEMVQALVRPAITNFGSWRASIAAFILPTPSSIESIRGVSPDGMIRALLERDLIREVGRKEAPGRPTQYGTSNEFLRSFGLASIADLPKLDANDAAKFGD